MWVSLRTQILRIKNENSCRNFMIIKSKRVCFSFIQIEERPIFHFSKCWVNHSDCSGLKPWCHFCHIPHPVAPLSSLLLFNMYPSTNQLPPLPTTHLGAGHQPHWSPCYRPSLQYTLKRASRVIPLLLCPNPSWFSLAWSKSWSPCQALRDLVHVTPLISFFIPVLLFL